jgi:peroxiredoxin Q/BCP
MEVCSLRDAADYFEEYGVRVYGISLDDVAAQAAFAKAQKLNFPLLSDPDGSVAQKFGVLPAGGRWTQRVTFIIDDEGVLRHIDRKVDVQTHGDDLLNLIEGLQG